MISNPVLKMICMGVTTLLLILSCTMTSGDDSQSISTTPGYMNKYTSKFPALVDYGHYLTQLSDKPIIFVQADSCENSSTKSSGHIRIFFSSSVKDHTLDIQFTSDNAMTNAYVDGVYALKLKLAPKTFNKVCTKDSGPFVVKDAAKIKTWVISIFEKFAPECQMSYHPEKGWSCSLLTDRITVTKKNIHDIRKAVIRGSRQPYSLSRKIAITEHLFEALQKMDTQPERLQSLCRIIKYSDQNELPLSLSNTNVTNSLCNKTNRNRKRLVQTLVANSIEEIANLRTLYRSYSKVGLFQIKIPQNQAPSKDLWVTVSPEGPLSDRIDAIQTALSSEADARSKNRSCWHPFFSDDTSFTLKAASLMGLISTGQKQDCHRESSQKSLARAMDYIFRAISSETEFVVSNGNAKLLRLPKGEYKYSISAHSRLPGAMVIASSHNTSGGFKWFRRRPSVVVRKWK